MQSPPPKKAILAAREAQRHSNAGNNAKAIEKLRLALEIHPDFAEARTNLGVQYIRTRQFESALAELNEANRLQPGSAVVLANLSYALFSTGQSEKAEDAARRAVELDGNNVNARYLFGFILSMRGSNTRDAISNLKMACDEVPKARLALAQFYARLGNRAAAEEELNRYLAHAKGDEK